MGRAHGPNHAHQQPIEGDHVQRTQARRDAQGKGHKADGQVVRHDCARGQRFHGHNRLRPHLAPFDAVDHLRPKHLQCKVGIRQRQQNSRHAAKQEDGSHHAKVGAHPPGQRRPVMSKKNKQRTNTGPLAQVDDTVGASQQLIQVARIVRARRVLPQNRQVGGNLPVKQSEFAQIGTAQIHGPTTAALHDQRFQAFPVRFSRLDPEVGDHR